MRPVERCAAHYFYPGQNIITRVKSFCQDKFAMDFHPLPFHSPLERYDRQAAELLQARSSGDPRAIGVFHRNHPRFLDDKILWLPKNLQASEIQNAALDLADAQLAVARLHSFQNWAALRTTCRRYIRTPRFSNSNLPSTR